jgi:hypothetical protein
VLEVAYTYPLRLLAFSVVRGKSLVVSVALFWSLLLGAPLASTSAWALATHVKSIPAGWLDTFSTDTFRTENIQTPFAPQSAHVNAKSTFIVDYLGVPDKYKAAIQAAINIWSDNFDSRVPINVSAQWVSGSSSGLIASSTPGRFFNGFDGAPDPELWYPSAMANALAGKDLDPANPEISIKINSVLASSFYPGTDGNCPSTLFDLETVLIHEIAHGLGFISNDDYDSFYHYGTIYEPTPFDAYAVLPDGRRLMDIATPSAELGKVLTNPLFWSGSNGVSANNNEKPLLYTPSVYEPGSSVSHLDQVTFGDSGINALMAPDLSPGQVIHEPGTLLLGIMADMRVKPPVGLATGIPNPPRNVKAIVGDRSIVLSFDPPTNNRSAQVNSYLITTTNTGAQQVVTNGPVVIKHLVNGVHYLFTVAAKNQLGTSEFTKSNLVTPQNSWPSTVIDPAVDAKYLVTGTFNSKRIILYSDSQRGDLKMATLKGKSWQRTIVDGYTTAGGRTRDNVSGYISMCTSKVGKTEQLNIFYGDLTDKDLRYASFNGTTWHFEVIDGNGPRIQPFTEPNRVATASDVSVSSACVYTPSGLQVFYRDESQGILLGAVQDGTKWRYEVIDGDRATDGRTTGDVAFHVSAVSVGTKIYLGYDSILALNQEHLATRGEVRLATRSTAYPEDWKYSTLQATGNGIAVGGYDISLIQLGVSVSASWFVSTGLSLPKTEQIRWLDLTPGAQPASTTTELYGAPAGPLASDAIRILFGCGNRLCSISKTDRTIKLVSDGNFKDSVRSALMTFNGAKYALVGEGGKLTLYKFT